MWCISAHTPPHAHPRQRREMIMFKWIINDLPELRSWSNVNVFFFTSSPPVLGVLIFSSFWRVHCTLWKKKTHTQPHPVELSPWQDIAQEGSYPPLMEQCGFVVCEYVGVFRSAWCHGNKETRISYHRDSFTRTTTTKETRARKMGMCHVCVFAPFFRTTSITSTKHGSCKSRCNALTCFLTSAASTAA